MKPIATYQNQAKLRLALQGPSGTGKSTLAMQFPNAYFLDIDRNLAGPLRTNKKLGRKVAVGYDTVFVDDNGKDIPKDKVYPRFIELISKADDNPDIGTIVLDSGTNLVKILMDLTLSSVGKTKFTKQEWGVFFELSREFMTVLVKSEKHVVLTLHEKTEKSESGAVVYPVQIAWPGQMGPLLGTFFTDIWRCEIVSKQVGMTTQRNYMLRTSGNHQFNLKNSLNLPELFEFNWETIEAALCQPLT